MDAEMIERETRGKWVIELDRIIAEGRYMDQVDLLGLPAEDIRWFSWDKSGIEDPEADKESIVMREIGCFWARKPFALLQDWWPVEPAPPLLHLSGRRTRPFVEPQRPYVRDMKYQRGVRGWSWAKLSSLATYWKKKPEQLWHDYFFLANTKGRVTGCLDFVEVTADPHKGKIIQASVHARPYPSWWVPAGWAHNVSVMCYFGYAPPKDLLEIIKARCA